MFAFFEEESRKKTGNSQALKAQGKAAEASRYDEACAAEGVSYGKAGLKLVNLDIPGFIDEAKKGIEARCEQQRIIDRNK
jgi:hypothetical protein